MKRTKPETVSMEALLALQGQGVKSPPRKRGLFRWRRKDKILRQDRVETKSQPSKNLSEGWAGVLTRAAECAPMSGSDCSQNWVDALNDGSLSAFKIPGGHMLVTTHRDRNDNRILHITYFEGNTKSLLWARKNLDKFARSKNCTHIRFDTANEHLVHLLLSKGAFITYTLWRKV